MELYEMHIPRLPQSRPLSQNLWQRDPEMWLLNKLPAAQESVGTLNQATKDEPQKLHRTVDGWACWDTGGSTAKHQPQWYKGGTCRRLFGVCQLGAWYGSWGNKNMGGGCINGSSGSA